MSARVQHAAVYDPVRDRVLVMGGDGGVFLNDVWALNLSGEPAWEQLTPGGRPPSPRREHTAIYDPVGNRVILYGGFDGAPRGDLWSLNLDGPPSWSLLGSSTVSPANRSGHAAVYDASRRRMVVVGGEVGPRVYSGEVWALSLDVAIPLTLSLVATEVNPDLVRLTWTGDWLASLRATLFRSVPGTDEWTEVGSPVVEGDDRLVYEDRAVVPGAQYGYRLVARLGAGETTLDPVWVTVPRRAILHLTGATPNPSARGVAVRFSLPDDRAASLELFDLRGRRIASRAVGSLGAGEHLVSLSDRPDLPAGIYLVRLTRERSILTAKACVVK